MVKLAVSGNHWLELPMVSMLEPRCLAQVFQQQRARDCSFPSPYSNKVASPAGLEPATCRLGGDRAIHCATGTLEP